MPDLLEACVPNKIGRGKHDDHTGAPCTDQPATAKPSLKQRVAAAPGNVAAAGRAVAQTFSEAHAAAAGNHATRILKAAASTAGQGGAKAAQGGLGFIKDKWGAWEEEYGRGGAVAMLVAAAAFTAIPVPGTMYVPLFMARGIKAAWNKLRGKAVMLESLLYEAGFTGVDAHGHHWVNGEQVKAHQEEPVSPSTSPAEESSSFHAPNFQAAAEDAKSAQPKGVAALSGLPEPKTRADATEIAKMLRKSVVDEYGKSKHRCRDATAALKTMFPQAEVWTGTIPTHDDYGGYHYIGKVGNHFIDVTGDQFGLGKLNVFSKEETEPGKPFEEYAHFKPSGHSLGPHVGLAMKAIDFGVEAREKAAKKKKPVTESLQINTHGDRQLLESFLLEAAFTGTKQVMVKGKAQTWYYQQGKRVANPTAKKPAPRKPAAAKPAPADRAKATADKKAAAVKVKQDAAAAKVKAKEDAARQYAAVRDAAGAAAKDAAAGKALSPEQLGHLGQAVLTLSLKDLQALKKGLGAAGSAGSKAGAVKAIKDRALAAAKPDAVPRIPQPPPSASGAKEPEKPAAPAFNPAEHHAAATGIVSSLAGKSGVADMVDVRKQLAAKGLTDRGQQDAVLNDLRRKGVLTASPYEGRFGLSPEQQAAGLPDPGTKAGPGGQSQMGLLSLKGEQPAAPKPAEIPKPAAAAPSSAAKEHGAKLKLLADKADANHTVSHQTEIDAALKDAGKLSADDLRAAAEHMGIERLERSKGALLKQIEMRLTRAHRAWTSIQV